MDTAHTRVNTHAPQNANVDSKKRMKKTLYLHLSMLYYVNFYLKKPNKNLGKTAKLNNFIN